jgi:hypothetical protein
VAEFSEKISFLRYLYREICLGFSEFKHLEKPIFIKHLTELEVGEIQKRREDYVKEAKEKGLEFQEDKLIFLTNNNLWERSKDIEIENLEKEISNLHQVGKNLFIKRQVFQNKQSIKKSEKRLLELNEEKTEALGYCVEDYLAKKINENYMFSALYKNENCTKKYFTEESFDKLDALEFSDLMYVINSFYEKFSHEQIKRLAACSFAMNTYQVCNENAYYFYGKFAKDLTSYQINLFSLCKYFKGLISHAEGNSPPPDVAEDPDKMIEWYDTIVSNASNKEQGKDSLGVGHVGANKEELQKMAGGGAVSIGEIAKKKGGSLTKEDFMKMHGI